MSGIEFRVPEKIFLYAEPVDLRYGKSGLSGIVRTEYMEDPSSGVMYLFFNKSRTLVKGIFWDRTGYVILSKRLEAGKYSQPSSRKIVELDAKKLRLFLDGLKIFL